MSIEAVQDDRIHIEKINAPFLSKNGWQRDRPRVWRGIKYAVERNWLEYTRAGLVCG
ncbi:hypothetical protein ACRQ5Q_41115 (plasmid) [Bradyrhizobium sp. PMVTL-01]|uniref:hypothetical protein n=1 Tax=Bradyrhizobium sp. PMVTL-01 TaxID=3434999 RepID=UPI003F728AC3